MTLYAQHGYGKGDKLNRLAAAGHIGGIVLSPADEGLATLQQTVRDMRMRNVSTVLDPQAYVYGIPEAVARCHDEFGLDFGPLTWGSLTAADVQAHVAAVIAANVSADTDGPIIAPSPRQMSFADPWTPFALQYARTTLEASAGRPVLASVVIEDTGLGDWDAVEQWLNIATTLDTAGFYIVVGRRVDYPSAWEPNLLTNLARLVYRLAVLNDYQVIVGYADVGGLTSIAAGASAIASGWSYRQRQFLSERWVPRKGGQAATPRVTSAALLAPLYALGEADAATRTAIGDQIIPNATLRARISGSAASWTNPDAQVQHLEVLGQLVRDIEGAGNPSERFARLLDMAMQGSTTVGDLRKEGVRLAPVYGASINAISTAVANVRKLEGL